MSFCLYELAKNPDIQRKVQKEIDEITAKHNGEITYNSISEMKYLEMCMDGKFLQHSRKKLIKPITFPETLRKYPVVTILNRECTKEYTIPGTNVIIDKGTAVIIPVLALHRNAEFYPEPEKFIPERFFESENGLKPNQFKFNSFNGGPRLW